MHIALLNAEFAMNGAALLLFRWAEHLARAGHRVSALQLIPDSGPLRDAYLACGVELPEHLAIDRSMVVICNTVPAAQAVAAVAPNARTIWWIHEGEIGASLLTANPGSIEAFSRAAAIIFPSATIRDRVYRPFLSGVPEQRLHVVPPGLDWPAPDDAKSAESPPDQPMQVAVVGTICPRKRQADLIRAVARLPDLPLQCLLVGRLVMLESDAVELARQAPQRFRFAGEVSNAEALRLISRADIFALPSESECFPLAPLEAGLRGKPVVLSDLTGHAGIWRHGRNCLMHPVSDVDRLMHALHSLAIDPALRVRLGEAARRTAKSFPSDLFFSRLDMVLASLG
jgi:glycosyltransferase involved in cell wall biosynthesis